VTENPTSDLLANAIQARRALLSTGKPLHLRAQLAPTAEAVAREGSITEAILLIAQLALHVHPVRLTARGSEAVRAE
jgi:hypothetical protein